VRVEHHADAATFLARAGAFLLADDAVNGLIYGIASRVREGTAYGEQQPFFITVADGDGVVLAALRTPPYNVVVSAGAEAAGEVLGVELAEAGQALPGASGPSEPAMAFARAFTSRRGLRLKERTAQLLFMVREVIPARPGPGRARPATVSDRPLLIEWFRAFDEEAVGDDADPAGIVDRHLEAGSARLYDGGDQSVCMLVALATTERGVRIGGVYTPPKWRGRGYASRLVADVTRAHLDGGAEYVSLFTDRANATSNGVYQALGYEPVAAFTVIDFVE